MMANQKKMEGRGGKEGNNLMKSKDNIINSRLILRNGACGPFMKVVHYNLFQVASSLQLVMVVQFTISFCVQI